MREVNAENIFTLAQASGFYDLIALQRSIGLHLDLAQLIVRVFEEQTLRSELNAKIETDAKARGQHDLRDDNQDATVAVLRRLMGPDPDIEKMLLAALPWI
jgi:hypothetical protein